MFQHRDVSTHSYTHTQGPSHMPLRIRVAAQAAQSAKSYLLKEYQEFPNSSLHHLPLVIYRPFEEAKEDNGTSSSSSIEPNEVEELLSRNGLQPAWRYGM